MKKLLDAICAINDVWDALVLAGNVSNEDLDTIANSIEKICCYVCHSKEVDDE